MISKDDDKEIENMDLKLDDKKVSVEGWVICENCKHWGTSEPEDVNYGDCNHLQGVGAIEYYGPSFRTFYAFGCNYGEST